ncbi:dTDP-4-amino-4,6-dideoxy-D-galactose acyltransferase [Hymenobacter daecheongensis DSM 21074]|uniref:dTDP-4-amino-4,6-dideoxy-D-galactose acyltransferase n=1 Tax=Hymenobacter daecheongensis DSM 21074 TaxID=1121955 RepID=A0A1M6GFI1_9BACT|nr:GNAT family N-acetyltransferase [Hymenobacter daecheongensis]SHJ08631.1 dTDP-4-amino-4,6-dideoxy-D-galactose acyltransferase [Hymenobacter daecheongensis DSM 21074]
MSTGLELLPWDTDLFGYKVAELRPASAELAAVRRLIAEARQQQVRLLYWFIEPHNEQALAVAAAVGALLVDRKVTYLMAVPTAPDVPAGVSSTSRLTPQLYSLAIQSGCFSRYRLDPGFAPDVYERLYSRWIENSVSGARAREVLVYQPQPDAEATGLATLGIKHNRVNIDLLAVDAPMRGLGIGAKLIQAARQRTHAWGFRELEVVTQLDNEAACRMYERCGFHREFLYHTYHIWLE